MIAKIVLRSKQKHCQLCTNNMLSSCSNDKLYSPKKETSTPFAYGKYGKTVKYSQSTEQ